MCQLCQLGAEVISKPSLFIVIVSNIFVVFFLCYAYILIIFPKYAKQKLSFLQIRKHLQEKNVLNILKQSPLILSFIGLFIISSILHLKDYGSWQQPEFSYLNLILVIFNTIFWICFVILILKKLNTQKKDYILSLIFSVLLFIALHYIPLALLLLTYIPPVLLCPNIIGICDSHSSFISWSVVLTFYPLILIAGSLCQKYFMILLQKRKK